MLDKFDIQRLTDLPIEEVARGLHMDVLRHRCLCPFHDDGRPSLTFNTRSNRYRCFVCDARGSNIDLVMKSQGWTFRQACTWMASQFGLVMSHEMTTSQMLQAKALYRPAPKQTSPGLPTTDTEYLEGLMRTPVLIPEARDFLFHERRISPSVVRWLGISSISSPVPAGRGRGSSWFNAPSLLIPYRDTQGRLLSVQARYLGKREGLPRFQFPRGSRCGIFNLPILPSLTPGESLYVSEGVTDCLALLSSGRKAIAIPSATLLKQEDAEALGKADAGGCVLHMIPDNDQPGERLYLQLRERLPRLVHHQLPPGYKDFGQWWAMNKNDKC